MSSSTECSHSSKLHSTYTLKLTSNVEFLVSWSTTVDPGILGQACLCLPRLTFCFFFFSHHKEFCTYIPRSEVNTSMASLAPQEKKGCGFGLGSIRQESPSSHCLGRKGSLTSLGQVDSPFHRERWYYSVTSLFLGWLWQGDRASAVLCPAPLQLWSYHHML